ncbi:hypothetical protein KPL71_024470 [Citrus sinensis]|uniref:Uncharacterized protein n=1 Tax=Citrus sinensis TaxID=2711 RepID=A0ACB8IS24_CITSI|nr:hypothetical protein KPL71_024470 [Citrus sinensis]
MVEGETSRIRERSTETVSGDTSGGRRDLSNRYSAHVIGGQKIGVEKFDGKINFGISCLTKEVEYLVKDEEYAMTLWRTLEEKYLLKSPENYLHVMSQVYGFRMKPGVSMHDHVSRFEKLLADLKNLDEDIKDEVKAMILLHSLPEEYSHFVTTLIYGKSVIIFKDVCTTLTNLEIRNNNKNSERASSEALAQKRDEKKPAAANMARKNEDFDYSLSITPAAYVASSSEWILDTGATYHLCPIKEWFTDFSELESGAFMMENDQLCRTMGIRIIRLKMFGGMIRELKKVRFVSVLKKNLISVGVLEAKGYKITIRNGTMKFTHGAMVILQEVRRHNLYYLKGGTTDETNIVEAHSDTTKLWHIRLGHAEEKSLQTLMRHGLLKGTKTCKLNFCEHCVVGKKTRVKFGTANHNTREILEYVHSDNEGIKRHFTVRHTPQQNGVAEHMNRTLLEKVRCMLSNAGLDKSFGLKLDVTFDEASIMKASIMKASSSQQVENKTKEVLQRVEFDATPYVPVSSTSKNGSTMEVTPRVEEEWKLAMEEEMKSLHQNQTWELVKLPKGKRTIGNKWVYTKKQESLNQTTPRYKARLVAKGFTQKEGIDYNEVFSPVVKHTSIRILLVLVAEYELELAQLDVKTTFVHGDLEEEIYMIQPCGFRVAGKENHVCRSQEERDYMARVPYARVVLYLDKRRSTTGYIFTLSRGPVSWRSILQSTIALSTTEVKYMATTKAVKEAIWLKDLLGDLGVIQENIVVFCDNQSAIFLAKNQTYHARTKHIDVKYHYVKEIIESGVVLLRKIDTKDNLSDMLRKIKNQVNEHTFPALEKPGNLGDGNADFDAFVFPPPPFVDPLVELISLLRHFIKHLAYSAGGFPFCYDDIAGCGGAAAGDTLNWAKCPILEVLRVSDSQGIAFDIFTRCFAFDYLRPFAYSKNGNIVLIYDGCCKLYWYNLKDLGFERIELPGRLEHFREVTLCADSPVPLDAGTGMGVQRSE